MLKKLLLLITLFFSALSAGEKPLIVGTNTEFPPFSYIEDKIIVGFDIDIAEEVAKRLGRSIEFKDMPFDALLPQVVLGHVDFVAAGVSYTEERAKRVLFTKSYIKSEPFVIFTLANIDLGMDDLTGKNVVVVEGFTADAFISSKGIEPVRLPIQSDAFMAVKSGRADAFITAKSTADAFFELQDASMYHTTSIEGTGETCAIMVPKKKPEMLLQVQNALDQMEADGTLAQIKNKWNLP